jgi:hypothetical protein
MTTFVSVPSDQWDIKDDKATCPVFFKRKNGVLSYLDEGAWISEGAEEALASISGPKKLHISKKAISEAFNIPPFKVLDVKYDSYLEDIVMMVV